MFRQIRDRLTEELPDGTRFSVSPIGKDGIRISITTDHKEEAVREYKTTVLSVLNEVLEKGDFVKKHVK